MKENKEQVVIEQIIYTADDGAQFDNKSQCECYEKMLECEKVYLSLKRLQVNSDAEHEFVYCNTQDEFQNALDYLRYAHASNEGYDEDYNWVRGEEWFPIPAQNVYGCNQFTDPDWYCFEFNIQTDVEYVEYIYIDSYMNHKKAWENFKAYFDDNKKQAVKASEPKQESGEKLLKVKSDNKSENN